MSNITGIFDGKNGFEELRKALNEGMSPDAGIGSWPLVFHFLFNKDLRLLQMIVQAGCNMNLQTPMAFPFGDPDAKTLNVLGYYKKEIHNIDLDKREKILEIIESGFKG